MRRPTLRQLLSNQLRPNERSDKSTDNGRPLTPVQISPLEDIVADMRAGRIVIRVDDEDREYEGDLLIASDFVTPEAINFMA